MKFLRDIILLLVLLKSVSVYGQNALPIERLVKLNSANQVEITYRILNDSLKGFFNISESFSGKVKLVNSKSVFPHKFENNLLQISAPKLILNEELIFVFKTFEEDLSISGNASIENYPNIPVPFIYEKVLFKLAKVEPEKIEPVVVVKEKVVPVEVKKKEVRSDTLSNGVRFRVQISAASGKMNKEKLKSLTGLSLAVYEDLIDNYYKYTIGNEPTFSEAQKILDKMAVNNFKKPFIVAYFNGKRVTVQQALAEIKAKE